MSEVKETVLWTFGLFKSVNVSSLSDLPPEIFVKCRSKTWDVMTIRLFGELKLIDGCQKKIVKLNNSYDQLNKASMINYDETVKLAKESEHVAGKAATEVVDPQREVESYFIMYIHLLSLQLTTLAERRIRGDLIETFKIVNGLVDYGMNIFNVSRSGSNIITKVSNEGVNSKVKKLRSSFISERVRPYWNNLPGNVKKSESVDMFKFNLESFKKDTMRMIIGMCPKCCLRK